MKTKHNMNDMKTTLKLRVCCTTFLTAVFLLALAPASRAANLDYNVTLHMTSSILNNTNAPFSLDLQLATGSGNVTNSVALSNFVFTGVTAAGTSNYTAGTPSGSFASTLTLTVNNSTPISEFAEAFSTNVGAITGSISFHVSQTTISETVGSGTAIPDQFNVFIDDNNTTDGFVPTTAPGGTDALLTSAISSGETVASVNTYSSSSPDDGVTTNVQAVPEPGSWAMLCIGGLSLLAWRFKGRHA
jgi:small ligand-binding sensory domain FIST